MTQHFRFEKEDGKTIDMPILHVPVSLEGLTTNEQKVIAKLAEASQHFIPICARQRDEDAITLYKQALAKEKEEPALTPIIDFFSTSLTPYDFYAELQKGARTLNIKEQGRGLGLYPRDITKEEAKSVEERKHSIVVREEDGLRAIPNSEYFREHLEPACKALKEAEALAEDERLKRHLATTRALLLDESQEHQDEQLKAWLENESGIDLIFDTAREEGSDEVLGIRGFAGAGVFKINKEYDELTKTLRGMMGELDRAAPWKHKAAKMDAPRVRFVDVITWAGDFTHPPICVLAQNLPNEQARKDEYGTISIMYANVTKLAKEQTFPLIAKEFFSEDVPKSAYMENLMTAVHELGHATSKLTFNKNPVEVFGNDYTILEEARAETFALWAVNYLREKEVVTADDEIAGYYAMLESLIGSLLYPPREHAGSRNLMLHYFLESGAIREENGRFKVVVEQMRKSAKELLARLADTRSEGRVEEFKELLGYISTERKEEFEKRFAKIPRGRIVVFPTIKEENGKVTIKEPVRFREQQNSLGGWLSTQD